MVLYVKKPIPVEAKQWFKPGDHPAIIKDASGKYVVPTLEGHSYPVYPGVWIITGVKGEHYPCAPDVFAETYKPYKRSLFARIFR